MAKPVIDAHSIVYIQGKKLQSVSYRRIRSRIERLIAKEPKSAHYLELAYLEARKQYWERAQVAIESALQIEEENLDAQLFLAQILEIKQEINQAYRKYQELLEMFPNFSKAYREFGRFLKAHHLSEKLAQASLLKALELNPQDPMAHILLAEVFIHKNRQAQALLHLEIAERYQEIDPLSHERMAQLWTQLEQFEKALCQWKQAIKIFPRHKWLRMQFRKTEKAQNNHKSTQAKAQMFWEKWGFK